MGNLDAGGMAHLIFLTSTPTDVAAGSGTWVGISVLRDAVLAQGHQLTLIAPPPGAFSRGGHQRRAGRRSEVRTWRLANRAHDSKLAGGTTCPSGRSCYHDQPLFLRTHRAILRAESRSHLHRPRGD